MKLRLQRFAHGHNATLGLLYFDDTFQCFTLEDEARTVKVPGETRIAAGLYEVCLRTEGRIHKQYKKKFPEGDTDGCILVGFLCECDPEYRLAHSTIAYKHIYPHIRDAILRGEEVILEVVDL
jgi:hypothetical protein